MILIQIVVVITFVLSLILGVSIGISIGLYIPMKSQPRVFQQSIIAGVISFLVLVVTFIHFF